MANRRQIFYNIFLIPPWFYSDSIQTCMPEKTIWQCYFLKQH